ncbi:hypothetical protein Scep_029466 [Stephania cephalantha]|uniref:Uncharacterized protein n=1 Tax=Stephania cephalantha TaxID=152367 RepID=A0AAP0HHM9_9MAGN
MHHSSSGYKKFHQTPLCYLSIVDPHGGFGFGTFMVLLYFCVSFVSDVSIDGLCFWVSFLSSYCTAEVLLSDLFQAKYGYAGLMYGAISACVFKLHFVQRQSTNFGLTMEFRERRISTRNQPKITLEKSDLQLYEGGVSAVNKSGAVNPQLMKPR